MLTRATRLLTALPAALLVMVSAPGLAPAAHADSLAWARQLGRDFRSAQQITKGKGVTVAILADGVDGRVATLRGAVKGGRDFVRTPRPKLVSGTLLASLIAGGGPTHDSPFGMRGLAPGVKILPVRVYADKDEPGARRWLDRGDSEQTMAKGIRYAADQGADVIMAAPYFWGDDIDGIEAAVGYAQSKNAVVVAGDPDARGSSPAAAPGALGVAAVTEKGTRYGKFSGKNSAVVVAAPGFKLPSIGPRNDLYTFWGSTPASAWVAATAALVRSEYPKLTPDQIAQVIGRSAHHPKGGYNTEVGFGIVNPIGALRQARALTKQPPAAVAAQGVTADKVHFGGAEPRTIAAVRHDGRLLAGFSGLAGAGLLILLLVLVLALRGRRRRAAPVAPVGPGWPGGQGWPGGPVESAGPGWPGGVPQAGPWHSAPGAVGPPVPPPAPGASTAPGGSVAWTAGPAPESGGAPEPAPESG
jgi:hypothetical protein